MTFKVASCLYRIKKVGQVDSYLVFLIIFLFSRALNIFLLISSPIPTYNPSVSSEDGPLTWQTQGEGRYQVKSAPQASLLDGLRHPCHSSLSPCPSALPAPVQVMYGCSRQSQTRVGSPGNRAERVQLSTMMEKSKGCMAQRGCM